MVYAGIAHAEVSTDGHSGQQVGHIVRAYEPGLHLVAPRALCPPRKSQQRVTAHGLIGHCHQMLIVGIDKGEAIVCLQPVVQLALGALHTLK